MLSLGASDVISESLFVQVNYKAQLNIYYTGSLDLTSIIHFLNFSHGFRF